MSLFLSSLKKSGRLDRVHMVICNVGSRKLVSQDDYGSQDWSMFAPNLTIYGFDADADACEEMNADLEERQVNWSETHLPLVLAKSVGESTLYVTKYPIYSSLLPPNEQLLARFPGLSEILKLDFTLEVETTTLDTLLQENKLSEIDFLEINVQGAELEVLSGASLLLESSVLAIKVKIAFCHLYLNQPLFADLDTYLRDKGFTLFYLTNFYSPHTDLPICLTEYPGQLILADAFYLRDLKRSDLNTPLKTPNNIFKLACIADILNFHDYALELLEYLTLHSGNIQYNFADTLLEGLSQFPNLVQQGLNSLPIVDRIRNYVSAYDLNSLEINAVNLPQKGVAPLIEFNSSHYQRHNQRRLEHLASLGLDINNSSVLEVGAGIGDHTSFFLDRECRVLSTEGRLENLEILRTRFPNLDVRHLDLDNPDLTMSNLFDIVYCYGLLYHLQKPAEAIAFMSRCCGKMLLLETCVSFGDEELINPCLEPAEAPSQAISGQGCRPTRNWVYNQLIKYFDFVYMPITQPNHEEFPVDWTSPPTIETLTRAIFIASRQQLDNPLLVKDIPLKQIRQ